MEIPLRNKVPVQCTLLTKFAPPAPAVVYFFKPVYILAERKRKFGQFWTILAILSRTYSLLVYYSQAQIVRWCTKTDKYQVCFVSNCAVKI